jgi:hypothetical protein
MLLASAPQVSDHEHEHDLARLCITQPFVKDVDCFP